MFVNFFFSSKSLRNCLKELKMEGKKESHSIWETQSMAFSPNFHENQITNSLRIKSLCKLNVLFAILLGIPVIIFKLG